MSLFTRALVLSAALLPLPLSGAFAQTAPEQQPLPAPSPAATVSQRVGVTDLSLTYSSPAVNGREIWGGLVPWGEMWRAGANAATKLTSSHAFTFGGSEVPAGTYSVFLLPTEAGFTWFLNSDSSGEGIYGYNEAENVATLEVQAAEGPARERLTYLFTDTTDDGTTLTLEWAGLAVAAPIAIDTPTFARAVIDANLAANADQAWRPYFVAARYYLESGQDLNQAAAWMEASIGIESTWWNNWFMAEVQAGLGNTAAAIGFGETAMELGGSDSVWNDYFLADAQVKMEAWRAE
jgi:hypothetical protein